MKRLLRHEWKYYFVYFILLTTVLFLYIYSNYLQNTALYDDTDIFSLLFDIDYCFKDNIIYVCVLLLILKLFLAIVETNASSRCFLQSLPVSSRERFGFHIIMDIGTTLLSYLIIMLIMYFRTNSLMTHLRFTSDIRQEIQYSIFANCMISMLYLLCIMALYYIISSVIVIGWTKIVFSFAAYATLVTILSSVSDFCWSLATRSWTPVEPNHVPRSYNYIFTHPDNNFAPLCISYLCIAIVLIAASIWLCGRHDEAAEILYFPWIKYIFAAIPAFYLFIFYQDVSNNFSNTTVLGTMILCLAIIIVFLFFSFLLTPDRQKPSLKLKKKLKANQQ